MAIIITEAVQEFEVTAAMSLFTRRHHLPLLQSSSRAIILEFFEI